MESWISQLRKGVLELAVLSLVRDQEAYGYQMSKGCDRCPDSSRPKVRSIRYSPGSPETEFSTCGQNPSRRAPPALLSADWTRQATSARDGALLAVTSRFTRGTSERSLVMSTVRPISGECSDLINRRLDDIDRVLLLAELPRAERSEVVQLVESQIYEMLMVLPDSPQPSDVSAVLQKLDPPQAYAPPEYRTRVETAHSSLCKPTIPAGPAISAFSIVAGITGGMSLLLIASAVFYVTVMVFANDGDMQIVWVLLAGSLALALLRVVSAPPGCRRFAPRQKNSLESRWRRLA